MYSNQTGQTGQNAVNVQHWTFKFWGTLPWAVGGVYLTHMLCRRGFETCLGCLDLPCSGFPPTFLEDVSEFSVVMWSASIWVQSLLSIGQIINPALEQNISCHLYASHIQLYCYFKASKIHKLSSVINCLTSMKQRLSDNYTCSWTLITLEVSLSPQTVLFLRLSSTLVL